MVVPYGLFQLFRGLARAFPFGPLRSAVCLFEHRLHIYRGCPTITRPLLPSERVTFPVADMLSDAIVMMAFPVRPSEHLIWKVDIGLGLSLSPEHVVDLREDWSEKWRPFFFELMVLPLKVSPESIFAVTGKTPFPCF
ncbi:hypothetical protein [Rhizobium sp. BK376]|uniref:hypothetical protein n=1 Tax=Rhizobium sp. BK376 TaxID=2512149 RepID=UPI001A9CE617|nr:hypothetical protein [Rhizobium sp. BK376]